MTAYLPVVRREGSRPLLAGLRPAATIPPASLSYKCARAARTPYLLFIISYLLSILPRPRQAADPALFPGDSPAPYLFYRQPNRCFCPAGGVLPEHCRAAMGGGDLLHYI